MRSVLLLILGATLISGCVSTAGIYRSKSWEQRGAEKQRELLIGKWLGESPVRGGGSKVWLMERFADGTFVVTFKNVAPDGTVDIDTEYGDWGISGDVAFTMTRGWIRDGKKHPVGLRESYYDDAYYVRKLTPGEFVYEPVVGGEVFSVKKVSADFHL